MRVLALGAILGSLWTGTGDARTLRLTRRLAGDAVRVVETATASGVTATIASKRVLVG